MSINTGEGRTFDEINTSLHKASGHFAENSKLNMAKQLNSQQEFSPSSAAFPLCDKSFTDCFLAQFAANDWPY